MGYHTLPTEHWVGSFELKKIYKTDFEKAKAENHLLSEIEFIRKKSLPQFKKLLKQDGSFPFVKGACKKMVDYLQKRADDLEKGIDEESTRIYFLKDGKRQMSGFDWITEIEKARGEKIISDIILPTHNFEMLKAHRLKNVFEAEKAKLIEENRINKIETDEADLKLLYIQFLKDELKYADEWAARISKLTTKSLYKADLIQIEKYKVFVSQEISKQETSVKLPTPKKQNISFVWQGNAETELPKLHQRLIKAEMIDEQTDLEAFKDTFTGKPTDNIKPIKWEASNKLLAYFLDTCFSGQDWQSIADKGKLFQNKKGKLLTQSDLSSANDRKYGKPRGYEKIDEILTAIKKH